MSQNETHTRPKSYSSSSNGSKPSQDYGSNPSSPRMSNGNNNYRYSSSAYTQARHYASPEESDAVIPVFSTPTHMYLKQALNSTTYTNPSPKQQYAPSPTQRQYSPTQQQQQQNYSGTSNGVSNGYYEQRTAPSSSPPNNTQSQQYGRTRGESSPARPAMDHFGMNAMENEIKKMNSGTKPEGQSYNNRTSYTATPASSSSHPSTTPPPPATPALTPQQDLLLAQLVDMGFTLEASRVAMIASGGTNLQEVLDILVQDARAENQIPSQPNPPPSYKPAPPTRPANGYQPAASNNSTATAPPPPPPSRHPEPPKTATNEDDDDEDDPRLEKEREELFKKEQERRRKEYLEQLKQKKPTPAPAPRPPPKAATPTAQPKTTSDPATFFADKERKEGNFLFNKNQFPEAEAAYTLAIDALPPGHTELVLLSNNRAAARLKQNKYHECLSDCAVAIDIARAQIAAQSGDTATWKSQMAKALHRKACALEGLHLFEAAIGVYEEYVRLDGSRSAQVSQGIMRCQQALSAKKQPPPQPPRPKNNEPLWKPTTDMSAFPDIDFNMFIPKQTPEQKANLEEINKSKAVKEMREREKKKEAEEAERLSKEDKVSAQLMVWKRGKDRNLRALLGSLESILWPGVQWKAMTMGELLEPRKCKVAYMKAIAKVHPDKLPANATVEQRMLASGIFTTLNQAWDIFRKDNNL